MGEGELTHVVFFRSLLTGSLTERPHRGFSVGLEALDETDAVLLSCGFHGADVDDKAARIRALRTKADGSSKNYM